jgi:hypothetical protein
MTEIIKKRQGYKGSKNPNWKGSVRFITSGHLEIYMPNHPSVKNNRLPLHRFVYEYFNKCCLLSWIRIHHINGIKTDNHKHNLQPMMISEHMKIHMKGNKHGERDMIGRYCLLCDSDETYVDKKGHQQWYFYKNGFSCSRCHKRNVTYLRSQHNCLHVST